MRQSKFMFFLCLMGVLLLAACDLLPASGGPRLQPQASGGATPTPVPTPIVPTRPTYTVERGNVVSVMEFTGRMVPVIESELFFRVNGRVRDVYVRRNEFVDEGQILADLEIDQLERQLESAQFDLEAARNRLAAAETELDRQVTRAEIRLEIEQLRLARLEYLAGIQEEQRNLEDIQSGEEQALRRQQAEVDLRKATLALERAQAAYDRIAWSDDAGRSSQGVALELATLDFLKAQAAFDLATLDFDDIESSTYDFDIALQERQVALSQLDLMEIQDSLDPRLIDDIQAIELRIKDIEATIADATLTAPFSGQLLSFNLEEGDSIQAFDPVAIVSDPNELEVRADLTDAQMQELEEGMVVLLSPSGRPGEAVEGVIRSLPFPYGGTTEVREGSQDDGSTRITVEDVQGRTGFGLSDLVSAEIVLEEAENVLWLPPQAIRTFSGRNFVVVQDGELQRRVDIEIGIDSNERIEIESGLEEGQIVLGN